MVWGSTEAGRLRESGATRAASARWGSRAWGGGAIGRDLLSGQAAPLPQSSGGQNSQRQAAASPCSSECIESYAQVVHRTKTVSPTRKARPRQILPKGTAVTRPANTSLKRGVTTPTLIPPQALLLLMKRLCTSSPVVRLSLGAVLCLPDSPG